MRAIPLLVIGIFILAWCPTDATSATVVYLHRDGATFRGGTTNSITNRVSRLGGTDVLFPAWSDASDEEWAELVDCVRQQYAAYDLDIVATDPSPASHTEVVIVGGLSTPEQTGGSRLGWVVDYLSWHCAPLQDTVAFVWPEEYGSSPAEREQTVCRTATHALGAALGLRPTLHTEDAMYYNTFFPGLGSFRDVEGACGWGEPVPCYDDNPECPALQNAHQYLLQHLGPAPAPTPTPTPGTPNEPPPNVGGCQAGAGGTALLAPLLFLWAVFGWARRR